MRTRNLAVFVFAVAALALTAPALAVGPVDVEVGAQFWKNDLKSDGDKVSADGAGAFANVWFGRWGVRGGIDRTHPDNTDDIDYYHLDVQYRLLDVSDFNYVAVGAGLERIDFGPEDTSGPRVSVDGGISVKVVQLFGTVVYAPKLSDIDINSTTKLEDVDYRSFEAGVAFHPLPFLRLRAGYRDVRTSGEVTGFGSIKATQKGPFIGASVKF